MQENIQKWNDSVFSFAELGFQEFETIEVPDRHPEAERLHVSGEASRAFRPAWMATLGIGQAGHRARLRHRRHPAGVAEAGRRLARVRSSRARPATARDTTPACRSRSRPRSRSKKIMEQRAPAGHAQALAWRRRGAARARRRITSAPASFKDVDVSHLRARRREHARSAGATQHQQRPRVGRVRLQGRERPRRRARRGAAESALDAVELMDIGWNFRREHLRLQQRSHYVIPNGGDQPNVVPPNASVWYYFRETELRRRSRSCGTSATRWRRPPR